MNFNLSKTSRLFLGTPGEHQRVLSVPPTRVEWMCYSYREPTDSVYFGIAKIGSVCVVIVIATVSFMLLQSWELLWML